MSRPIWIKVCGVRTVDAARDIVRCRPDAIGLNFFAKSPRSVDVETAAEIVRHLPEEVEPIGLFVNHPIDEVRQICEACGLSTVQLHGDETPEFAAELKPLRVLRAFRVGEEGLDDVERDLERYETLDVSLVGCLVDARIAGAYGGTGHRAPWDLLARHWPSSWPHLVLAGGLAPENVAEAIATVGPWGVDVASGVESAPGVKSPELVRQFVERARTADAPLA